MVEYVNFILAKKKKKIGSKYWFLLICHLQATIRVIAMMIIMRIRMMMSNYRWLHTYKNDDNQRTLWRMITMALITIQDRADVRNRFFYRSFSQYCHALFHKHFYWYEKNFNVLFLFSTISVLFVNYWFLIAVANLLSFSYH